MEKRVLYTVVSPQKVMEVERIVNEIDEKAFVFITNIHGTIDEGSTYAKPSKQWRSKLKQ